VTSGGITFILHFVTVDQLVQMLKWGGGGARTNSMVIS
jgi:hypothetical protein